MIYERLYAYKKNIVHYGIYVIRNFISGWISKKVETVRNQAVHRVVVDPNVEKVGAYLVELGSSVKELGKNNEKNVKEVYYKYLIVKWLIFLVFSYVMSCLLFLRIKDVE